MVVPGTAVLHSIVKGTGPSISIECTVLRVPGSAPRFILNIAACRPL
jgi:hypothetical protein